MVSLLRSLVRGSSTIIGADGSGLRQVTTSGGGGPAWSPDAAGSPSQERTMRSMSFLPPAATEPGCPTREYWITTPGLRGPRTAAGSPSHAGRKRSLRSPGW
jgi:hypothetical protein